MVNIKDLLNASDSRIQLCKGTITEDDILDVLNSNIGYIEPKESEVVTCRKSY